MKRLLLFLLLLMFFNASNAQSGYLGSVNNVSFSAKAVPSLKFKNTLNDAMNTAKRSARWAYVNYEIGYSRIVSKKLELGVGYSFSSMKLLMGGSSFTTTDTIVQTNGQTAYINKDFTTLDDPRVALHQVNFDFRYFRLGSLAPTGKYIGFGIDFGTASIKPTNTFTVGQKGEVTSDNFFVTKYDVIESREFNMDNTSNANFLQLNANIGRNYPLTQNLMLGVGMTFPVFTTFLHWNGASFGFNVNEPWQYNLDQESDITNIILFSQKKYKRLSLDLTLKYFL